MLKYITPIILLLLLAGCAHQPATTFKPLRGLALSTDAPFTTVEFLDTEILLYQGETLMGSIQRAPVPEPDQTAIEALKEGFMVSQGGSYKPVLLETPSDTYAYVVHTPNFSTIFVATQQHPTHWAVISVRKEYYTPIASSLAYTK